MSHHHHKEKRWSEEWHVAIGTGITIALIFAAIFLIGTYVPMAPLPEKAAKTGALR